MAQMRLVVVGAGGRMGRALTRAVTETDGAELVAAVDREGSDVLGRDAGELAGVGPLGVAVGDDPLSAFARADGVLGFYRAGGQPLVRRARRPGAHCPRGRHDGLGRGRG